MYTGRPREFKTSTRRVIWAFLAALSSGGFLASGDKGRDPFWQVVTFIILAGSLLMMILQVKFPVIRVTNSEIQVVTWYYGYRRIRWTDVRKPGRLHPSDKVILYITTDNKKLEIPAGNLSQEDKEDLIDILNQVLTEVKE